MDEGIIIEEATPDRLFDGAEKRRTQEFLSKIIQH
jgi:ABC-type polar amino acid transport system ATPase subunit